MSRKLGFFRGLASCSLHVSFFVCYRVTSLAILTWSIIYTWCSVMWYSVGMYAVHIFDILFRTFKLYPCMLLFHISIARLSTILKRIEYMHMYNTELLMLVVYNSSLILCFTMLLHIALNWHKIRRGLILLTFMLSCGMVYTTLSSTDSRARAGCCTLACCVCFL